MGCGELTDVRVEGITCCDRAADVGRTSWACRLNWPDVAVDRRSFGRSGALVNRPSHFRLRVTPRVCVPRQPAAARARPE